MFRSGNTSYDLLPANKPGRRFFCFCLLLCLCTFHFEGKAQQTTASLPPATVITGGQVTETGTRKSPGSIALLVTSADSGQIVVTNARGAIDRQYLFYHVKPEDLTVISVDTNYVVTKYTIRTTEHGVVYTGNTPSEDMFYIVTIKVFVSVKHPIVPEKSGRRHHHG